MKFSFAKKFAAMLTAGVLSVSTVPIACLPLQVAWADGAAAPTVDGKLTDWPASIQKRASTDSDVDYWQVAKDSDGNVYLAISGVSHNSYYFEWQWNDSKSIGLTLNGSHSTTQLAPLANGSGTLKGSYAYDDESAGKSEGPLYVEVKIDASSFKGQSDYAIDFAGTTVQASEIPAFDASQTSGGTAITTASQSSASSGVSDEPVQPDQPARYGGITIDGDFSDWGAVQAQKVNKDGIVSEAMVFDHDTVYLYLEDTGNSSATWSGPSHNGRFAIQTDLGHDLMIHVERDKVLAGGQETTFRHVGDKWEIAVPASLLPAYQKTISFGFYQGELGVKDVANLDDSDHGNAGSFDGIVYDGDYSDWRAYPHTVIQYAGSGTQEEVQDSEGALYSHDGVLYTHMKTTMPTHLGEKGGEFLWSITYDLGDGRLYYPRFAAVDSDGTIHRYSGGTRLSPGTHEFYLFSTDTDSGATNINNLAQGENWYGRVTVTVGKDGKVDEMESEIYLDRLAEKFKCDASDFKDTKAQFGRLGQKWIEYAGTPTGAVLGTGLATGSVVAAVGGYALYRRRRQPAAPAQDR